MQSWKKWAVSVKNVNNMQFTNKKLILACYNREFGRDSYYILKLTDALSDTALSTEWGLIFIPKHFVFPSAGQQC